MPQYRRAFQPGGTFFFTIVTENRAPLFTAQPARDLLHVAFDQCRATRPFTIDALALLPEHFHILLTLPPGDHDYPARLASIKTHFTRTWLAAGGREQSRSASRLKHRRRGVWQRHFWEHLIRDKDDYNNHLDYICYNPVKHQHAPCPHAWPRTTFHRHVNARLYALDWCCTCNGRWPAIPSFETLPINDMELE
jgi:putative transposase